MEKKTRSGRTFFAGQRNTVSLGSQDELDAKFDAELEAELVAEMEQDDTVRHRKKTPRKESAKKSTDASPTKKYKKRESRGSNNQSNPEVSPGSNNRPPIRGGFGSSFSRGNAFSKKRGRDDENCTLQVNSDTEGGHQAKNENDLWIKKYQPFNLDSHVIHKKKREEFVRMCTQDEKLRLLFIQGPTGSGKNSMIECFGEQYNYEIVRYRDEKSKNVVDVFGENEGFNSEDDDKFNRFYPDDLEKLIYFIRTISKCSMNKMGAPPVIS